MLNPKAIFAVIVTAVISTIVIAIVSLNNASYEELRAESAANYERSRNR